MEAEQDITTERYYHGIDVIALFFYVLKRSYLILFAAVIGAFIARYDVTHNVTPVYQATSKIYIAGSETSLTLYDLQLGSSLAKDYQEIFKISDVHEKVAEKLGLNYSYSRLSNMVSVKVPSNSHILYISVESSDPEEARALADAYAEVAQDYISYRMELKRPLLLEKARTPRSPVSPNVKRTIKDGAAMGGCIPLMILVLLFLVNDRIRSEDDIIHAVQLPVFGSLPVQQPERRTDHFSADLFSTSLENRSGGSAKGTSRNTPKAVITRIPPVDDVFSESINTICTGISFAGSGLKAIVITSCSPNEGKSFLTLQLSISMARRGNRILLIDADLRKSVMCSRYGIQLNGKGVGLAHFLSGQCEISDAVYTTNIDNLYLIPAGELVTAPLALISTPEFEGMVKELQKAFDRIIIDTPPLDVVIDAAEVARCCDGSILVVENRKTSTKALKAAAERLRMAGTPVLGCIRNKVKGSR